MSKRGNNRKRQERYQRNLDRELEQAQSSGPSEGLYYVFDLDTKEKHKFLNRKEADALWQKLPHSFIMPHIT